MTEAQIYFKGYQVLAPHQQRMVEEFTELSKKLDALNAFFSTDIFQGVAHEEQERLRAQAGVMQKYADILEERIAAF